MTGEQRPFESPAVSPPPVKPARQWDAAKGELTVEYHGLTILTASVTAKDADGKSVAVKFESKADTADEKVEQILTGYCTWWAYRNGFSQTTLDAVVDVFVEKHLPDFGYEYIQLDDCCQIGNGNSPRGWLTWNDRWPGGPEYTINKIRPALCTMAGGVLMVSDKVEVYQDDLNLEGMRRSAPVLFTVPGQLYDYSPRERGNYHAFSETRQNTTEERHCL